MQLRQNPLESEAEFIEAKEVVIRDVKNSYGTLLDKLNPTSRSKERSVELNDALADLLSTASIYRMNRQDEVLVPRVSKIAGQLGELAKSSARSLERWSGQVSKLDAEAIEALLGGFPFAQMRYTPVYIDGTGKAVALPGERSGWVPADGEQQRQDLKHLMKGSSTGLVKPTILPSFAEIVCMETDAETLGEIITGTVGHLLAERDRQTILIRHLVRRLFPIATEIFARLIPAKFNALANAMEEDFDQASNIFLGFVGDETVTLLREMPVKRRMVMLVRALAAQCLNRVLQAGNLSERRKWLLLLATTAPSAFVKAVRLIVERIDLQYGKDVSPTGMGRRITRAYAAPATWVLIRDVLDRIWPAKRGPLSKSTSMLVFSVVEATYRYGELEFERFGSDLAKFYAGRSTGIGNTGRGSRGRLLYIEHVRTVSTWRHARHQLNCALEFLERERQDVLCRLGATHPEALRLEATVRVLGRWQGELEWRLLHGAYEKELWRKPSVPRFPQMDITLPIEDRTRKIVVAARLLINDMLASMTGGSTGQPKRP